MSIYCVHHVVSMASDNDRTRHGEIVPHLVADMFLFLHHDNESDFDAESFCVMVRYVPCSSYFEDLRNVASNSDNRAISYRRRFYMTMLLLSR